MASYKIPDIFRPGFAAINLLSIDQIKDIANSIKEIPPGTSGKKFKETLKTNHPIKGINEIADALLSLGNLLNKSTAEEISEGLASAYSSFGEDSFRKEEELKLSEKIFILLENSDNFKLTYRAIDLLSENPSLFAESRILTDVRPMFDKYCNDLNGNSVVLHQLKIEYVSDEESKKFFVSLNLRDLKNLKEVVDRAISKHTLIEEKYKSITNIIELTD